jgi:putative hydrolase of the HAD superfamily
MIKAILLDLDDTLYDEAEYVISGFRVVAKKIAALSGAEIEDIHAHMLAELASQGRGRIFDATLAAFDVNVTAAVVHDLVERYREHRPSIQFYPEAEQVLDMLNEDYRIAIVTDGLPVMQKKKIEALGLNARVDAVIYCWEHEAPKPDVEGFRRALDILKVEAGETLVVGDRPDHDLAAASALECRAVRLRRGRYAELDSAPYQPVGELFDLNALPGLIHDLNQ